MKNLIAKILFLLLMAAPTTVIAQYQYLFDNQSEIKHRNIKVDISEFKQNVENYKMEQQIARENHKASKQTVKHTYSIQTFKTRMRMKASRCTASRFNGDHSIWCATIHRFFTHGQLYYHERRGSKCPLAQKH